MNWHELPGETPEKGDHMIMDEDNFNRVIAMRDELIDEQRTEISNLKAKVNQLTLKLESKRAKLAL